MGAREEFCYNITSSTPNVFYADTKVFVEMLLKVLVGKGVSTTEGGYTSWSKDAAHRREAQVLGVFREIWPDKNGPLPWRLTQDQIKMLDQRMGSIIWPSYIDRLHYDGCSFWIKPGRMWKAKRKVVRLG